MKHDRLEELARLAYEATMGPHHFSWKMVKKAHREPWLRIARTLYAAAMRDAAGVARDYAEHPKPQTTESHADRLHRIGWMVLADELSNEFETIAKETDSDNG